MNTTLMNIILLILHQLNNTTLMNMNLLPDSFASDSFCRDKLVILNSLLL